jgi:lipid II:glycine glycyltransferase (peptidoglycan interpeptide bridge formation enzyme)
MAERALDAYSGIIHGGTTAAALPSSEAERWDRFVEAAPGGDIVQTTIWAQAKRALGFEVCQVVAHRGDEIAGGGQIIITRFGRLGALGYVARGPLVREACPEQATLVLAEIERAARAKRVRHLIIQPPEGGDFIIPVLAARGYAPAAPEVAPSATLRIDLSHSLDQILAHMSASKRYEVRRSQRQGVQVRFGGREDLDLFHGLHEATARRQKFRAVSRSYLHVHWEALNSKGWTQLFFACHQGRPLAAMWATSFGDTVTGRLSGWNGQDRRLLPNVALEWRVIEWAKGQGFRFYDLGGIERRYAELILADQPLPRKLHSSPAAFKREFGAHPVLLPTASQLTFNPIDRLIVRVVLPPLARWKSFRQLMQRLRNG